MNTPYDINQLSSEIFQVQNRCEPSWSSEMSQMSPGSSTASLRPGFTQMHAWFGLTWHVVAYACLHEPVTVEGGIPNAIRTTAAWTVAIAIWIWSWQSWTFGTLWICNHKSRIATPHFIMFLHGPFQTWSFYWNCKPVFRRLSLLQCNAPKCQVSYATTVLYTSTSPKGNAFYLKEMVGGAALVIFGRRPAQVQRYICNIL